MNKVKRIFAFILAIALAGGVLAPLFYMVASAAVFEVGSATEGIEIVSGTPDSNFFKERGIYRFKVETVIPMKFEKIEPNGTTTSFAPGQPMTNTARVGGLLVRNAGGTPWVGGETFTISIVPVSSEGADIEPVITLRTTGLPDPILRYRNLELNLTVVDYNRVQTDVNASTVDATHSSSSFPLQAGKSPTVALAAAGTGGFATFDVKLPVRYSGKGDTVSFTISYRDVLTNEPHVIKCNTTIPNTKEYVDPDEKPDVDDKDPDPLIPYIIVESYSYGSNSVTAGEDFDLELTLRNTSDTHSLQNIVMNISPMGVFSMGSSSNTLYLDELYAGSTVKRKITINTGLAKVTDDKDANSINIKFDYQYLVDKKRVTGTSNEKITLPVTFPDRFELSPPEMQNMVFAGEEMYIYMGMVNKGRSSVYNLTASVKGDMANPGQPQYIGNLNAGSESGAEFTLRFEETGDMKGVIVVTYEDANMNPKEATMPFSLTVQEMNREPDPGMIGPMVPEEPTEPVDTEKKPDPKRNAMMVVAIAVCAMSTYITIAKAKAKRSIFVDEEL